ncbi:MAG TPA: hypothetical protein VMW93_01465, partial [bacterium]|nr:hypothetical protein [bacterium]
MVRNSVLPSALTIGAVLVAALCWAPAPASGVGSIVSSFRLSGYGDPYANGIYVGDSYVSVIYCTAGADYLYRYRFNGTLVGSFSLTGTSTPRGGDAAHLGNGYISLVDSDTSRFFIYRVAGGSPVASFAVSGPGGGSLQDVMWTGSYYEVSGHLGNGRFNRYTSTGSFAGTVAYDGWPEAMMSTGAVAFSDIADGRSGSYLVASSRTNGQPSCIVDVGGRGSLVATFGMPSYFATGGCCGRSSKPQKFGTAYWT